MSLQLIGVAIEDLKFKFSQHEFEWFCDSLWIDNRRLPIDFPTARELAVYSAIPGHRERIKIAFFAEVQFELDIRQYGLKVARRIKMINAKK